MCIDWVAKFIAHGRDFAILGGTIGDLAIDATKPIRNTKPRHHPDIMGPWADACIATYLEKDVRSLLRILDLGREFFWRDKTGHEIDYLLQGGEDVAAFEGIRHKIRMLPWWKW
jgi:hypothetical protein